MNVSRAYGRRSLAVGLLVVLSGTAAAAEFFVSPAGRDENPGTMEAPFRTVKRGIAALVGPGDVLNLRHGVYVEPNLDVRKKVGTAAAPIRIRSYPNEHAYIDGTLETFRKKGNADWEPARNYEPQAHPDEYVSVQTFPDTSPDRGVFLDRNPYTRLITYSRLEDLRAGNAWFARIRDPNDSRPGPLVYEPCTAAETNPPCTEKDALGKRYKVLDTLENPRHRRPWVYMGPGIWYDDRPDAPTRGRLHIRLSPTANNIPGLFDYNGETDPRQVALGITPETWTTLVVAGSKHVVFENLSIRYGGDVTLHMEGNENVVFDHVRVFAASYGVRSSKGLNNVFRHSEFDGGTPTWYFRTDRKAEYDFLQGDVIEHNNVGAKTSRGLMVGNSNDVGTVVAYCEFRNAHDLYAYGAGFDFHHNWIHNLNDEALYLDAANNDDIRIHENVITRSLSALSFANEGSVTGRRYLYRNLVDLRSPTAGYRPALAGDPAVWRYGHVFKIGGYEPPYHVFQNTFVVVSEGGQASYLHFRNMQEPSKTDGALPQTRTAFNNIFVAMNRDSSFDTAITFLPSPCTAAATDGNAYYRTGPTKPVPDLYRSMAFSKDCVRPAASTVAGDYYLSLAAVSGSALVAESRNRYAPGFENSSIEGDVRFASLGTGIGVRSTDDFRLSAASPAIGAGVVLPDDLKMRDPFGTIAGRPDIGAFPAGSAPLRVGVDARRSFPQAVAR